jgi:hypothetical protein
MKTRRRAKTSGLKYTRNWACVCQPRDEKANKQTDLHRYKLNIYSGSSPSQMEIFSCARCLAANHDQEQHNTLQAAARACGVRTPAVQRVGYVRGEDVLGEKLCVSVIKVRSSIFIVIVYFAWKERAHLAICSAI